MMTINPIKEIDRGVLTPFAEAEFKNDSGGRKPLLMWAVRDGEEMVMFVGTREPRSMLALPELWLLGCKGMLLRPVSCMRVLRRLLPEFRTVHGPAVAWVRQEHLRFAQMIGLTLQRTHEGWCEVRT